MSPINVALLVVAVIALVYIVWYAFQMRAVLREERTRSQSTRHIRPVGAEKRERSTKDRSYRR